MSTYYPPPHRTQNWNFFSFLLLAILVVFLVFRFWPIWERTPTGTAVDKNAKLRPIEPRGDLAQDEKTNVEIFQQCSPSSVNVQTFANIRRDPFSFNILKIPQGSGTGIIWDDKGRIVTNYHVISNARQGNTINPRLIQVTLANHETYNVYDVNFAVDKDLAVLWINAPTDKLHVIKVGESKNLQVGQKVFAIGNPFGLDQSLTTGIISALGREIQAEDSSALMRGLIQTDAAINPGNSGGPLLDSAGRLIGVNTAIVSPSGASAGIGFSIPVDEVNRVVTQLIRREKKVRPALGIYVGPAQVLRQQNLKGVLVLGVIPDGPADKAGIRPTTREDGKIQLGDIIVAIDGKKITSPEDLFQVLENDFEVNQDVTVTVLRNVQKDPMEVNLKLTLTGSPQ
jgi:S1-C subfamily serine protease